MKELRFPVILLCFLALGRFAPAVTYSPADDLPGPPAHVETIPSGSLVIPMDNTLQALVAPFNLKAYGLVNELLQRGIPVKWAIAAGKAKDGVDFTATAQRIFPTAQAASLLSFKAGPFIVHKDFAGLARAAIAAWNSATPGNNVAVYELTANASVDIRYDLKFKPNIGISTDNSSIHTKLLDFAKIPDYQVVLDTTILASSCYTIFTQPHTTSTAGIPGVNGYVRAGGNLLCECKAIDTYENLTTTRFQSTLGYTINNVNTVLTYPNADLGFSQFEGALEPNPGGSEMDWNLATGSVFQNNAHIHAQNSGAHTDKYAATVSKLYNGQGGLVFYIGGHDYGAGGNKLGDINGQRMILNAIFHPTVKFAACGQDFSASIKTISGTIYEDVNGDSQLGDAVARPNVAVRIYADANNNGVVDAGDVFLSDSVTDAAGAYSFTVSTDISGNNFLVVANSKTVTPSAGLRGGYTQGDVWAEQTYGDDPTTAALDLGSRFGGRSGTVSDNYNASDTTPANNAYEHVARVNASTGDIAGVNFAFSFNAVTSTRAGDTADDDTSFNRTVQGSLRQFLQNANAITGANAMRFTPAVATNASDGGGSWWNVSVTSTLPAVVDAQTTIDGRAYSTTNGTSVRDDNPGSLGTGGTVGVDTVALGQVARPELAITDGAAVALGLDVQANTTIIRRIAISAFGNAANSDANANIRIGNGVTGALIESSVIGTSAASFTDPGASRSGGDNIRSVGAITGTIQNNAIGFSAGTGITLGAGSTGWQILGNELRGNAIGNGTLGGVAIVGSGATVQANLIATNQGAGLDMNGGSGANSLVNNTFTGNGAGNSVTPGVRVAGAGSTLDRNVLTANTGAGIMVVATSGGNLLTKNSIYENGPATNQIGIDLLAGGDNQSLGTAGFVSVNDSGDTDSGANGLLNFPVIETAEVSGSNLVLSGWARPGSAIEFFIANPDPSGFGEGQTWFATLTEGSGSDTDATSSAYSNPVNGLNQGADTTNRFRFVIPLPGGVAVGTKLTSTATLGGETSEFSGNVTSSLGLSGTVFEDVNYGGGAGRSLAASGGVARSGARVELYDASGNFVAARTTDATGTYAFGGIVSGNYTVRVVSSTVTSSRTGYVPGLLPVQTFRTNATTGSAVDVTDRVGGETPYLEDAGNGSTTLAALTTATTTAQSITAVTVTTAGIGGLDFGFNFDTVVNVNDAGQGSLRQFITNANALANAGLTQSGLVAGKDNAVFMISNGTASPGLRSATNYFTGGIATIAPGSALPAITDPIVIDGTKQPGWTASPIIELNGTGAGAGANGLSITAGTSEVRGLIINRFSGSGIELAATGGNAITGNYLGTDSAGAAAAPNVLAGVTITGGNGNTLGGNAAGLPNLIAYNGARGVNVLAGTGNAILQNSIYGNTGPGIDLGNNGISANDGSVSGALANTGNDYPIFTTSTITGTTLTLAGYVGSAPGQATFANATVQVFKANNTPADQAGELILGDTQSVAHGEGQTYLGTLTTDASGNFSGALTVNGLSAGDYITATATDPANNTSEFGGNSLVQTVKTISGNVFEDLNYGGSAGRTKLASGGSGRSGARVELFDAAGNFLTSTSTDVNGDYAFAGVVSGDYTVRVVNTSVTSSRTGYAPGLLPVQTYRTDATTGTAVDVTDFVGGETPDLADAGDGSTTLAALTTATTTPQSIAPVTVGAGDVTGVDFGFSFDVVVNVNNAGQGALRQFLTNANALSNAGLAQAGRTAGIENAIFMISNGTAAPGLRATNNYFVGGIATISPTSAFPAVSDPAILDAATQPGFVSTPILEINGNGAGAGVSGLTLSANGNTVRGFSIHSFNHSGIYITSNANRIEGNHLGTNAAGDTRLPNNQQGIYLSGANNIIGGTTPAARNVLSGNRLRGMLLTGAGATGNIVQGNYVGTNAAGTGAVFNDIGIYLSNAPGNIIGGTNPGEGNLTSGNTFFGIYLVFAGTTNTRVEGNIVGLNAAGTAAIPNGARGIEAIQSSGNIIGGTVAGAGNIVSGNGTGGIRVVNATGNRILRNRIYGNTGVGIDLGSNNAVDPNDGAVGGPHNDGMDYPVFTSATLSGSTLTVAGYVGSAPGQATFANATIELFKADNIPADQDGEVIAGDGQSVPHGEGRTYLGTITADGSGNFNTSLSVTGLPVGEILTATATNAGNSTSEFSANFVVTGPGVALSGTVYADTNHNAQLESAEAGTGLPLYAKLIPAATPGGPASQTVAVDPGTGVYTFSNVAAGSYLIVIDDNNTPADVTPNIPAGWIGTEQPTQTRGGVAVSTVPVPNLNFGLFNGSRIAGTVFADTGSSGGTVNDGVKNGAEPGLANVSVRLTDSPGTTTLDEATTGGAGQYVLWVPAATAAVRVVEVNPASYISTGASVGTSGGTYDRAADAISFTHTPGTSYTGLDFGDVPGNVFTTDGQQAAQPGATVVYAHTFTAGSSGSVTFSTLAAPSPDTVTTWSRVIHRDTNSNGQLDSGEPVINGPVALAAGETISILVKEYVPADAPFNAQNQVTVTAAFAYDTASPPIASDLTRVDLTTVGDATTAGLALLKSVDKETALPGETISYTISYTNNSPDPVRDVVIFDTTPAFSTFVSAGNGPLPADLAGVTIVNPAVGEEGAVSWTFTGTLAPGATGTVTFAVKIAE